MQIDSKKARAGFALGMVMTVILLGAAGCPKKAPDSTVYSKDGKDVANTELCKDDAKPYVIRVVNKDGVVNVACVDEATFNRIKVGDPAP